MASEDKELRKMVQAVLDNNDEIKVYGVRAEVNKGHVELSGIVDTLAERRRLYELINAVPGVKGVDLGISISTDGAIDDEDVKFEVAEELGADPDVNLRHVGAKVVDGVVYLKGTVEDPADEQAALKAAAKARGVKDVVSEIKIRRRDLADASLEEIFHSQVNNDGEERI